MIGPIEVSFLRFGIGLYYATLSDFLEPAFHARPLAVLPLRVDICAPLHVFQRRQQEVILRRCHLLGKFLCGRLE